MALAAAPGVRRAPESGSAARSALVANRFAFCGAEREGPSVAVTPLAALDAHQVGKPIADAVDPILR
jgi:hypothetical protein